MMCSKSHAAEDSSTNCTVTNGDLTLVQSLFVERANVEFLTDGDSTLHFTEEGNRIEMASVLLEPGSDIDCLDWRYSPLYWDAARGGLEKVNIFSDKGVEIKTVINGEDTPLHLAVERDHTEEARVLLERGCDIECRDGWGYSPLDRAVMLGDLKMVNMLIDRGADIKAVAKYGDTPLHFAVERGYIEVARVLLERGCDMECRNWWGYSPLHLAVMCGGLEMVNLLIDRGADTECRSRRHYTPLHCAAWYGDVEIVEHLVAKGADMNATTNTWNSKGDTPLDLAANTNQLKVIEVLLAHGVDSDSRNEFGYTLLHRAAKYRMPEPEVVEVLVRNGADIMAVDRKGYTPLHLAAKNGHSDILKVLLTRDADPLVFRKTAFLRKRKTPLRLALEGNHQKCVELIKQHIVGESFEKFLIVHRRNFGEDLMDLVFSPGTKVNVTDPNGDSLLHTAARYGDLEVVQLLNRLGADFTMKNNQGETPQDIARDKHNESERVLFYFEEMTFSAEEPDDPDPKSTLTTVPPRPFGEATTSCSPYPQGRALDSEEKREVEFKAFTGEERRKLPWKMMEKAKKFIIACLNAGNQGTIYFGVKDNSEVVGLELATGDRDHITKALQAVLDDHIISDNGKMTKGGDQTCVRLVFVKVTVHGHPARDLFVVEIEVKRDWNLCKDSVYYTKTWKPKGKGSELKAAGAANGEGGEALSSQHSDLVPISLCYKVEKDKYDEPAIRTNGCTATVSHFTVEKQIKVPLRKKYKKWKRSQTLFGRLSRR